MTVLEGGNPNDKTRIGNRHRHHRRELDGLFLARGYEVGAYDPAPEGESFARRFIDNAWPTLEKLNAVLTRCRPQALRVLQGSAAATRARSSCRKTDPSARTSRSNCSRRSTRGAARNGDRHELVRASHQPRQRKCKHPERCVIGHPFNPPHLIPLVEVVGGAKLAGSRLQGDAILSRHRQASIQIQKEVKGHVANRLQAALWREAVHLVNEGVVSVADADAAIAYGPGLRWALMGPHLTFHMAGGEGGMAHFMSHIGPAIQTWMDDLGAPKRAPQTRKNYRRRRRGSGGPASPTCSAGATAS